MIIKTITLDNSDSILFGKYSPGEVVLATIDALLDDIEVVLPDCGSLDNVMFKFKRTDDSSNVVTISTKENTLIDGAESITIDNKDISVTIVGDKTSYYSFGYSSLWEGNLFSDYLDHPVKTTSDVVHNTARLTDSSDGAIFGTTNQGRIYHSGSHMMYDSKKVGSGGHIFNEGNVGIRHTGVGIYKPNYPLDLFSSAATETRLLAIGNTATGFFGYLSFNYSGATSVNINTSDADLFLGQHGEDLLQFADSSVQVLKDTHPTDYGDPFLRLGTTQGVMDSYRTIGMGYASPLTPPPVEIGYHTTSVSGYTKGDIVLAARDTLEQSHKAVERVRIKSYGDLWHLTNDSWVAFGSSQQSGIKDDVSDMVFDCDINSIGGKNFVFRSGNIEMDSGKGLYVNSIKIVGNQQAHIIDADGFLADITTKFNTLLSYLETHGILSST